MSTREDAHRLLDEVPEDHLVVAVELLRHLKASTDVSAPRRQFRTVGVFDGAPDLGRRAKDIARREIGGGKDAKSA